jgi:hypothetical protein
MTLQAVSDQQDGLLLPGLDGSNPLGFLAALGVLCCVDAATPNSVVKMSWIASRSGWNPLLQGCPLNVSETTNLIASYLKLPIQLDTAIDQKRGLSEQRFKEAKKKVEEAEKYLKQQRLQGKERDEAVKRDVKPLQDLLERRRTIWLRRLQHTVPSPEMALGKHLNATVDEFRHLVLRVLDEWTKNTRDVLDLLASFGSDACRRENSQKMESTLFCFITGSGHQYFLDTVSKLFGKVDAARLDAALSKQGEPADETLSMRWDPAEDRRYAMMWDDPTASSNKAKTNWAINLLAYQGLRLLPTMPGSHGLETTGWSSGRHAAWAWPIWRGAVTLNLVRSLLSHPQLTTDKVDSSVLAETGIIGVYQSRRIRVGNPPLHKLNFTPAQRII